MSVITVIEQINEITEEIIESTVIEIGDIIHTETDLVIHNLPVKSTLHPDDLALIEDSEDNYERKQVKTSLLTGSGLNIVTPPAHYNSTGTANQIALDDDYMYLCVSTDRWVRFMGFKNF